MSHGELPAGKGCGHPPSPVAMRRQDGLYVCHCNRVLNPAKAHEVPDGAPKPPGPLVYCNGCGCHVALVEQPPTAARRQGDDSAFRTVRGALRDLGSELEGLRAKDRRLRALVSQQAEDEGLWFEAATAPEAYLQQELRKLHQAVEEAAVVSHQEQARWEGEGGAPRRDA